MARIVLLLFTVLFTQVKATPALAFPINSQVPPVAWVSQHFSYTFSESTFSSTLALTYSLLGAPDWLKIDSESRTLSGTPPVSTISGDAVTGVVFGLVATDTSGSTTSNTTLVVSSNVAPRVSNPISNQLPLSDTFSTSSTLLCHPSTAFKFEFASNTFSTDSDSTRLFYYAITESNTPLPSWVNFDATTLSFSGQTPEYATLIQPPQTFPLQLIASDVEGFGGTSISFSIEVGVHLLAFQTSYFVIKCIIGLPTSFDGMVGDLHLDGQIASSTSISITADTPTWLVFDNSTSIFTGTPPIGSQSTNVTVHAIDMYGDVVTTLIFVEIVPANTTIFSQQIGNLNVTVGTAFKYDLSSYLTNKTDTTISVRFNQSISWLSFNTKTLLLTGEVPIAFRPSQVDLTIEATSKSSESTISKSIYLLISNYSSLDPSTTFTSQSKTSSGSMLLGPSATDKPEHSHANISHGLSKGAIAAIIVPVVLLLLSVLVLVTLCRRRRERKHAEDQRRNWKAGTSFPIGAEGQDPECSVLSHTGSLELLSLDTSGFENASSFYTMATSRSNTQRSSVDASHHPQTVSTEHDALSFDRRHSQTGGSDMSSSFESPLSATDRRSIRNQHHLATTQITSSLWLSYNHKGTPSTHGGAHISKEVGSSRDRVLQNVEFDDALPESDIGRLTDANFSVIQPDSSSALSAAQSRPSSPSITSSVEEAESSPYGGRGSKLASIDPRSKVIRIGGELPSSLAPANTGKRTSGGDSKYTAFGHQYSETLGNWTTLSARCAGQPQDSSEGSSSTDSTDVLFPVEIEQRTIRRVARSPSIRPSARELPASALSRPISRRAAAAACFFGVRSASKASKESRHSERSAKSTWRSFGDSPTVPAMKTLANSTSRQHRENATIDNLSGIANGPAWKNSMRDTSSSQSRMSDAQRIYCIRRSESNGSCVDSEGLSMQLLPHLNSRNHRAASELCSDTHSNDSWETEKIDSSQSDMVESLPERVMESDLNCSLQESSASATKSPQRDLERSDVGGRPERGRRSLEEAAMDQGSPEGIPSQAALASDDYTAFI